jgi:predicted restriction endonuclease
LEVHKGDGSFMSRIDASRHSRIWPISDSDVDTLLSAVREKAHKIAEYENLSPDPHEPLNLEKIEDATVLLQMVLRRYQTAFRHTLLNKRPNRCAITGTSELSVLEAAHIIPYAVRFADRDKPENGLLLRSDIHKLFDAHLISINPETKKIEVSDRVESPDYLSLRGKAVADDVSPKSLGFHFEIFQKQRP